MFVKRFQWGISESVVVALAYNHNSVISSSCYYMNGDLFEILSGSPSFCLMWPRRRKLCEVQKFQSHEVGIVCRWLRRFVASLHVRVSESKNLRVLQCAMWDFNKHRSNTVRSLNFFDIECEFLRRRKEIERVGWLALDFGPRRSPILRWISLLQGSNRLYQFQEIVKFIFIVVFKEFKKPHGPLPHRSDWNFMYVHEQPARWCVRRCFGFVSLTLCQRLLLPHFPHISVLRTVLFRFSDYFNFHTSAASSKSTHDDNRKKK